MRFGEAAYIMGKTMEIARAANAKVIGNPVMRNNFDARIGGSSHQLPVVPGPPQAEPGTQEPPGTAAWIPGSRKSAPRNDEVERPAPPEK